MYQYPYLEQFYKDNYQKLLDWNSPLRPSKSCPKNGAAGVAKFKDYYIRAKVLSFSDDDVHSILNDETIEDGDTIFHQNLRVMRELNFVRQSDGSDTKYYFTEQFISFVESKHTIDCYIIEQLMSIGSVDDLTMYFNFLICVMREAAIFGQVIQYRDAAAKFLLDVPNEGKRKEHQERIFRVYGFKGDQARGVTDNYTPNISYFCHAVLRQLGILTKSDVKIDNMGTLVLTPLGEMILKRIEENLQFGKQDQHLRNLVSRYRMTFDLPLLQIYYGAPGTGKSNEIKKMTAEGGLFTKDCTFRTTFHPDSDYASFVGAYKPYWDKAEEKIVYGFRPQSFLKAYIKAWKNLGKNVALVVEEINRGNCAQIFGDIFQLLDREKDGLSKYPIECDVEMQELLAEEFKDEFDATNKDYIDSYYSAHYENAFGKIKNGEILALPMNLSILATMNTSDQSLFPMDSAFKRRWEWIYEPIVEGKIEDGTSLGWRIEIDDTHSVDWWKFLRKINAVIYSLTSSEDKQLGYFFCQPDNEDGVTISQKLFVGKVIFYLWNEIFKDYAFEHDVCKKENKGEILYFADFYEGKNKIEQTSLVTFFKHLDENQPKLDNEDVKLTEERVNDSSVTDAANDGDGTPADVIPEQTEETPTENVEA